MKYCEKCGKEIMDEAVVCVHCGCAVRNAPKLDSQDTGSIGWAFLGFFVPLLGLILYCLWKDSRPNDAKKAGKGALIGFISGIVFGIIYGVIVGAIIGSAIIGSAL